jgi:hypothetical protein
MDYYQKDCQWCLNIICLKLQNCSHENTSKLILRDDAIRSAVNVNEGGLPIPQFIDVEDKQRKSS